MNILIFFIILLVLVLVHEAGHFFTAKKFGIRVDEFGFGFPPKLFGKKFGETEYTVNALPFGGFVKIFGENPDDENTNGPDASRSFVNKPRWQQAIVLFAGVAANFLLAWLLFSIGLMSGMPSSTSAEMKGATLSDVRLVVVSVLADSPAEEAGLKSGDTIVGITSAADGEMHRNNHLNPDAVRSYVTSHKDQQIEIHYQRGREAAAVATMTPSTETGTPVIGISMDEIGTAKLPFFRAFYEGLKLDWYVTQSTAQGLYKLVKDAVTGNGSLEGVTGPVGMVGIVGDAYKFGFSYLLSFAALISVNLAIINLLPFPALDGGRLFFLLVEKIKGSRMNPRTVNMANLIGFGILIFLMLVVTYHDIVKII